MDTIEISNGFQKIYFHRNYLRNQGLNLVKRKYGKSYYTKKVSDTQKQELITYCKKHFLKYTVISEEYIRSSNYRQNFMKTQNKKYIICAYCGFPKPTKSITVDHIIPVDKVKKNQKGARLLMKIFKIENVNSMKNLAPACSFCNRQKSAKMGMWIIRGYLGKNKPLWIIRWIIRIALIIILAILLKNIFQDSSIQHIFMQIKNLFIGIRL